MSVFYTGGGQSFWGKQPDSNANPVLQYSQIAGGRQGGGISRAG